MPMSAIWVLLLILISFSITTSPTSPAHASCTSVISAAYDPCLTLKLPPPSSLPANSRYSIIILSHYYSTPGHFSSHVLQRSHIQHSTTSWNDLPPELRTISLPPAQSLPITIHRLHQPPLSVTPDLPLTIKMSSLQTLLP